MAVDAEFGDLTLDGIRLLTERAESTLNQREDAIMVRIALSGKSRKILSRRRRHAYAGYTLHLIRRIPALVELAERTIRQSAIMTIT